MAAPTLAASLAALAAGCAGVGWERRETELLVLHYRAGSHAERNLDAACAAYEAALRAALDTVPGASLPRKPRVYLHESGLSGGRIDRLTQVLHYRYSADREIVSQHEFLHLLLRRLNRWAPGRLEEGVARHGEVRTLTADGVTEACELPRLARLAPESTWRVADMASSSYDGDAEGNVAAAFVDFLLARMGAERFWEFYREVDRHDFEERLEAGLGMDLAAAQEAFVAHVRGLEPPPPSFARAFGP